MLTLFLPGTDLLSVVDLPNKLVRHFVEEIYQKLLEIDKSVP